MMVEAFSEVSVENSLRSSLRGFFTGMVGDSGIGTVFGEQGGESSSMMTESREV